MPTEEDIVNQVINQEQVSVSAKSHPVNVELHLGTELHSDVELQNEVNAHYDYEVGVYERNAEILDRDAHSDSKAERQNGETRAEPRLVKYVKRHNPVE